MRRLISLILLAASVASVASDDLMGQAEPGSSWTSNGKTGSPPYEAELKELARRIQERDRIRIESRWGRYELRTPILTGAGLEYARADLVTDPLTPVDGLGNPIPLAEVDRIQIRKSNTKKGAIIGGLVGAGLGLAMGVALASDDFFDVGGGEVALVTILQGAGGALSGAFFGGLTKSWKTVYRRPETGSASGR